MADVGITEVTIIGGEAFLRSGWNSQLAYLRLIFRAKKALDCIEQKAGVVRSES